MGLTSPILGNDVFTNTKITSIKVKQDFTETNWNGMTIKKQEKLQTNETFYFLDNETGLFVVYGNGNMGDYYSNSNPYTIAPWRKQRKTLKYVIIEYGVTNIANSSFYYWAGSSSDSYTNIVNIKIGNSVKTIGNDTCKYCESLRTVTIGNSVESIGESAFFYCLKLTTVTIRNSVRSIGQYSFAYSPKLVHFYFYGTKEPSYETNVFYQSSSSIIIYVLTTYEDDDETQFCGYPFEIRKELEM